MLIPLKAAGAQTLKSAEVAHSTIYPSTKVTLVTANENGRNETEAGKKSVANSENTRNKLLGFEIVFKNEESKLDLFLNFDSDND